MVERKEPFLTNTQRKYILIFLSVILLVIALFSIVSNAVEADSSPSTAQITSNKPKERVPDAIVMVKVSRYNPELGGPNCFDFRDGGCQSPMANGERWEPYFGIAMACPQEWPFETVVEIDGKEWICKDRGGKIVKQGSAYWVDMLSREALYPHGTEVAAKVYLP
jgi:hypothetical protein